MKAGGGLLRKEHSLCKSESVYRGEVKKADCYVCAVAYADHAICTPTFTHTHTHVIATHTPTIIIHFNK